MEPVFIKTENENIVVYLDDKKIFGYRFGNDNSIKCIDESIFKYFGFLRCSSNYLVLGKENEYEIRLDNETGFKHYFKNGIDDMNMFYLNNGEDAVLYLGYSENEEGIVKKFRLKGKKTIILITISAVLLLQGGIYVEQRISDYFFEQQIRQIENISVDDLRERIYSTNLDDEIKSYLYNEDFFCDVLPIINKSDWMRYSYTKSFENINILCYNNNRYNNAKGYYLPNEWHNIYIKKCSWEEAKDVIAHEFVHLCQYHDAEYNLIMEASAEIISNEYYRDTKINAYSKPVFLVKKLMEIIGPEPIWEYNFTGDFSKIEEKVKPYLSDEIYTEFLNDLSFNNLKYSNKENDLKFQNLDNILNILYERIYCENIKNNKVINALEENADNLVRYYFNHKYINRENSYYLKEIREQTYYSIEDAIRNGLIEVTATILESTIYNDKKYYLEKKVVLTYDDYMSGKYDNCNKNFKIIIDNARFLENDMVEVSNIKESFIISLPTIEEATTNKKSKTIL